MDKNPKNSFYFIHPDDDKKDVFLFEESNHRWSTLRNYAKGRKEELETQFLLCIGVNGGEWDKGYYSNTIYYTDKSHYLKPGPREPRNKPHYVMAKVIIPHLIYDIKADRVYRLKCRLRNFNEVIE